MKQLIKAAATSLVVGAAIIVGSGESPVQAAEQKSEQAFDIGAQALASALSQFAKQSKREILYTPQLVANKKTAGVKGSLEPMAALSELLKDTGLRYSTTSAGAIVLAAAETTGYVGSPADQMRVANVTQGGKAAQEEASASPDQVVVQADREKLRPFTDGNADIPRTINDAQPYYIFDAKTIDQSGATNIEDFLKQRLTMNSVALTNTQTSVIYSENFGSTSTVNLRGLGADKTLILVDGRRVAGVGVGTTNNQPDLNGIPLNAIDRIEVLPSSASGIYGGSAIGGVVNVILKKDYQGGEIRANYDNTWESDTPPPPECPGQLRVVFGRWSFQYHVQRGMVGCEAADSAGSSVGIPKKHGGY